MSWLKEEGFGGVMIWSVDMDDYRGVCGTGKYPLINAMKQELTGYTVKLEYDGPYEATGRNAVYTTKDRKYFSTQVIPQPHCLITFQEKIQSTFALSKFLFSY